MITFLFVFIQLSKEARVIRFWNLSLSLRPMKNMSNLFSFNNINTNTQCSTWQLTIYFDHTHRALKQWKMYYNLHGWCHSEVMIPDNLVPFFNHSEINKPGLNLVFLISLRISLWLSFFSWLFTQSTMFLAKQYCSSSYPKCSEYLYIYVFLANCYWYSIYYVFCLTAIAPQSSQVFSISLWLCCCCCLFCICEAL